MIYTNIPYAPNGTKNLGGAYNSFMQTLPLDDDYGCFLDHDATFTTYDWYSQMEHIVSKYSQVGCFTGVTNRVWCRWQLADVDRNSNDYAYLIVTGKHDL